MKSTRLEFVQGAVGVGIAGLLGGACGDDKGEDKETGGTGGGTGGGGACATTIGTNHGHMMTVTKAQAQAGADKTYDITGGANHSHTVDVSAGDFADLLDGTTLMVTSSFDAGHSHEVTIDCS
jgi:hypothetical protein